MSLIEEELKEIRKFVPSKLKGSELIQCISKLVTIKLIKTEHKQLTVCFQFPQKYPDEIALIEIKSKVFSPSLVNSITEICDKEAKKYVGSKHILLIVKFLRNFLDENPLLPCREEIANLKKNLIKENDTCKVKQKSGKITIVTRKEEYYLKILVEIPNLYPNEVAHITLEEHNFPSDMAYYFICQAKEYARQMVEPPLKRNPKAPPFKPQCHLTKVFEFLITKCCKRYPIENCPFCNKRVLPINPKEVERNETADNFAERVFCGHLFHHSCMDNYMKTPPFEKGKFCPGCGSRIYHDKWRISPLVAEARWAHKQARERELDEIVDFLS